MKRKQILSLLLSLILLCSLAACGSGAEDGAEETPVELELWLYPLGDWNAAAVHTLLADFTAENPHITVHVTSLSEEDGSGVVSTAIEAGDGPDLLLGSLGQLQHAIR